ncbi:TAXI family TRAP transporter solute-binding subunit [Stratiformator vulcanicus]|uniref:TAXI family TRAP transporter solute-binding subunit n=1 Tax=Stratiformator vulcanicus TaxID=2527980 RepID=UPI0028779F14|nr:TAXI family TRAP transporter solute-binding subunit [Stratiformator vulcanicus]
MKSIRWQSGVVGRGWQIGLGLLFVLALLTSVAVLVRIVGRRASPVQITLATGTPAGSYHRFGQALQRVTTDHIEDHELDWRLELLTTRGSAENMRMLRGSLEADREKIKTVAANNGRPEVETIDLIIAQSDTPTVRNCRLVAPLFPEVFHVIADESIASIDDFRGKHVGVLNKGSRTYDVFLGLLEHYGLSWQGDDADVTLHPMSAQELVEAFERNTVGSDEGPRIDAMFYIVALGNELAEQVLSLPEAHLVSIDEAEALKLWFPNVNPYEIPKGAYGHRMTIRDDGAKLMQPVPPDRIPTAGVYAMLAARSDLDTTYVRELAEILSLYPGELSQTRPSLIELQEASALAEKYRHGRGDEVADASDWFAAPHAALLPGYQADLSLGIPMHPGVTDFLTSDEPSWLAQNAELASLCLAVAIAIASGGRAFFINATRQKRLRAETYNRQLADLVDNALKARDRSELETLWKELTDIFNAVVDDIEHRRISSDAFHSFKFPWDVAKDLLCHREILLTEKDEVAQLRRLAGPDAVADETEIEKQD